MLDYLFTKTPLLFFIQNLWRDEAYSYMLAEKSIGEIIKLTVSDFSPPLYFILLHFWMNIFGTTEVILRSLSFIFFAGLLYVVFEILTEVFTFSKIKSAFYLILFIVNPFLLFYAFEARMYMMVTFFIALAYYAFWTKKNKLYIFSMAAAIYTHYFAAFILIAHAIEVVLFNYSYSLKLKPFKAQILHKKNTVTVKPLIFAGLLFIPWFIYFLVARNVSDSSFWIIQPPHYDFWYVPFVLFTGYERVFGQYYHEKAGYAPIHTDLLCLLDIIIILPAIIYIGSFFTKKRHKHTEKTSFLKKFGLNFQHIITFLKNHRILISVSGHS
ncbi:MAG TPA: hypothetical protein PLS49_02705 [Candidatus Woesebacteria bacterium]|nr:hypothetical protein [Candidatus Woesebacteria bacterium]